ncbi:hypothetical protein CYMTET_50159 [Cymbomonas tetramitiformis]|uniref:UV radiation resistance-associated gene protein n=1 Tax=Cymbomonas tetramitiformis TaxID=36881 RepID=A0AAE0BNQ5_9CHLO|nr:hypothetical protein CYMTET_50159 [Cymbomonas tetramitiformis]
MGQRVLQTSCSLCENASLLCCCPTCANKSIGEKYKNSGTVFKQRQRLRDKIETTLNLKKTLEHRQRQQQRYEQSARLQAVSQRVAEKQERVEKMRQAIEEKRAENLDKARQLAKANSELAAKRQELLYNYYPDIIRIHSLQYSMLEKQLAGQQRDKLRRLRSMLPLRLHFGEQSHQSQAPQPRQVSICNIRLPLAEDFKGVNAKELAAALGYLLHFTNLAAKYLNAPMLHIAGFGASTSSIWQRHSFWDHRPALSNLEYPLYSERVETPSAAGAAAGSAMELGRRALRVGSSAAEESTIREELPHGVRRGLGLLKRSLGCISAQQLGPYNASPVDAGWSSLAVFTAVCRALSREPGCSGEQSHPFAGPMGASRWGSSSISSSSLMSSSWRGPRRANHLPVFTTTSPRNAESGLCRIASIHLTPLLERRR